MINRDIFATFYRICRAAPGKMARTARWRTGRGGRRDEKSDRKFYKQIDILIANSYTIIK